METKILPWKSEKKYLFLWLSLLICVLIFCGYFYFQYEKRVIKEEVSRNLTSVAQLKIEQIQLWQRERESDAETFTRGPFVRRILERYLKNSGPDPDRELIIDRLDVLQHTSRYEEVYLANEKGDFIFTDGEEIRSLDPFYYPILRKAMEGNSTISSDFTLRPSDKKIRMLFVSPILSRKGEATGFLILISDPGKFLYPLLKSWPVESQTAETYLVEKDGDSALVLNDLRFKNNAALRLRISLNEKEVPAVQAILGARGIVEGTDYKGARGMAYIAGIEGTPWNMICKVDNREVYRELWGKGLMILIIVMGISLIIILGAITIQNVRERKSYKALYEKEKALWASQQEFRATLYSIGDGVIATDRDARVRVMNRVAEKLTGWTEEEARGKPLAEVFHIINEETRNRVENPVAQVLKTGTVVGLANHTILIARDGIEFPIFDCGAPIFDQENQITGVVLVFRDQTAERQAMKKIEESDRLKSIFLANMSHEIRTPMNAILGFSGLLDDPSFSPEDKSMFIKRIHLAGRRLLRLINDLIDIATLEAGNLRLIFSECSLSEIISDSIAELERSLPGESTRAVQLRVTIPDHLKKTIIKTDSTRLQQVLENLISNALKYTKEGFIEIGVNKQTKEQKDWLEFYIKDTGKGIPSEKLGIIFERFRQAEENEYHEGTGLGLSITKGIVELMGGTIQVDSQVSKGTTFSFTIPYFTSGPGEGGQAQPDDLILNLSGKTIIIAEDDNDSFHYLHQLLASTQAEIIHAQNGEELIYILENRTADLILLDMKMPVKSGQECLHEIKSRGLNIKIIAQTAYAFPEDERRCMQTGCDGYLSKPLNRELLFPLIKKVICSS